VYCPVVTKLIPQTTVYVDPEKLNPYTIAPPPNNRHTIALDVVTTVGMTKVKNAEL